MNRLGSGLFSLLIAIVLLLAGTFPVSAIDRTAIADNPPAAASTPSPSQLIESAPQAIPEPAAVNFNIWYEGNLRFGQLGNPQPIINIMGNAAGATRLTYRLNGGPEIELDLGTENVRLVRTGDFNVSIPINSPYLQSSNTLLLTAQDSSGGSFERVVQFTYQPNRTWPLNYSVDWDGPGAIHDKAQVVDGLWRIESGGIRPVQVGYDRLVAIGDIKWQNYEVEVPITFHRFYPVTGDPGGVGIIAYWNGHLPPGEPPDGWENFGVYAYYSNRDDGGLALRIDAGGRQTMPFDDLQPGKTYIYKLRIENVSGGTHYSFKVWEDGEPEPGWAWENVRGTRFSSGSVLLAAHRVDATFGDVKVTSLEDIDPDPQPVLEHSLFIPSILK
ncbi:MAG: hypothetical protein GX491_04065 [Chloroflexi bacterium]|nr:hypothetical protein [Chloroflexota bacterium]